MADRRAELESTQLKLQIKFMKDLIDSAKSKRHNPNHNYEKSYHRAKSAWTSDISYKKRENVLPAELSHGSARKLSTRVTGKVSYYQKQIQTDRSKYSFVRASSAPVAITSESVFHKTQNVSSVNSAITAIQPSCSSSGEGTSESLSPKKTPMASSTLDLNEHSLESLRKILAAKMEAKAARKAKAALLQSDSSKKHTANRPTHNKSHNSLTTPHVTTQKQDTVTSHQTSVKITGTLMRGDDSKNVEIVSNNKRIQSRPQIDQEPSFHLKCSSQSSTGLSKISSKSRNAKICDVSQRSSQGNSAIHLQNSTDSFINLAGQFPSKGELAEGLKHTEAKIKELTAELIKLKEVAQIVSASPTKNSQKKTRKPNSSTSNHWTRRTSSNSSYVKAAHKKYGQSNTQHAARYVVSKYKLKKVHSRTLLETKYKSHGKVHDCKKTLHTFHHKPSGKRKQPHKPSVYRWSKPGKLFPLTRQTLGQSSHFFTSSGISHRKHSYMQTALVPFWKRQTLLRGSSGQRLAENRRVFGNRHVYFNRNLHKPMQSFSAPKGCRTITVNGVKFQIGTTGKTLQRINAEGGSSDGCLPQKSISRVDFRGVTYRETKPGMLEKSSSCQTRIRANQALYKSIAVSTGRHKLKKTNRQYCMFYCRFGKCNRGDNCSYVHDPDKVAVCTRFLRGTCRVENCPFSHKISKEKMPVCSYFLKGVCVRENCPYSHVNVSRDAKVCHDFVRGYCPRGEKCKEKHILECPEFVRTGKCPEGKQCKLEHRKKPLKRKLSLNQRPATLMNREALPQEVRSAGTSTDQLPDPLQGDQTKEPVPFKLMKLPAFISIVSCNDEPMPSQETPKPIPVKTQQEQVRIKPRL
ncbi:uncharacterized protein LOC135474846 [Liolophura sinensis]|uniref:uncharacterized protein LOC135474846 n=1 Tax=Liolophura sinensis TaxID=3198878 RepID=UPI003158E8EB